MSQDNKTEVLSLQPQTNYRSRGGKLVTIDALFTSVKTGNVYFSDLDNNLYFEDGKIVPYQVSIDKELCSGITSEKDLIEELE